MWLLWLLKCVSEVTLQIWYDHHCSLMVEIKFVPYSEYRTIISETTQPTTVGSTLNQSFGKLAMIRHHSVWMWRTQVGRGKSLSDLCCFTPTSRIRHVALTVSRIIYIQITFLFTFLLSPRDAWLRHYSGTKIGEMRIRQKRILQPRSDKTPARNRRKRLTDRCSEK